MRGRRLTVQYDSPNAAEPYYKVYIHFDEVKSTTNVNYCSYLEMALNGPLDNETRANLTQTHTASKVSIE